MSVLAAMLGWISFGLAVMAVVYTAMAGLFLQRFFGAVGRAMDGQDDQAGATILKPLHGAEPGLKAHLEGYFVQDQTAPLQIVFAARVSDDPALLIAREVALRQPHVETVFVANATLHGENRKISNLINGMAAARHPVIIVSDSDIGVAPDYLRRVRAALAAPGVGVVTCPYYGEARAGFWSKIAAMGLSYQFLPNVIAGVSLGAAKPCMGSTIALTRETLERIGGFEAFSDTLADDYAIGAAVRDLGLSSVVAPVLVAHGCADKSFGEMFAHELRWAKTVKGVDPIGHLGSIFTHALPLSLISVILLRGSPASLWLLAAAFLARLWLMSTVDHAVGRPLGSWWLTPMRDIVSLLVFAGSFFVRSVEWRGAKFHVTGSGDLKPQ
jgi:ceramide glucosyltransferase